MRRMNKKVLAAAVSTCLAVGTVATPAVAVLAKNTSIVTKSSIALADGTYTVDITILKETADSASAAASYFITKDLTLVVKNGSAKLQLRYSNPMIGGLAQVVDGVNETLPVYKEGTDNYVELAFSELNEAAYLYMEINTGSIFGKMKQKARVVVDESTLKREETTGTPSPEATMTPVPTIAPTKAPTVVPTIAPTEAPTTAPTEAPAEDGTMKDGLYETNVYLWHASNDQASMAASALNGTARISVKNGTGTIYIYTKQMSMGTITAYLQELKVETASGSYKDATVEAKDSEGNPTCFSFTLPHFEEYVTIKVNPHVALMGNQDIDARLKIDYSTVKEVKDDNLMEAPEETMAPSTQAPSATPQATKKPAATLAPAVTKKPSATTAPTVEKEEAGSDETTESVEDSDSFTWNDAEDTVSEEETEEVSEEEASEEESEEELEAAEEMLPETGDVTTKQETETTTSATEEKNNTPLVATAAACASSFLTSLLWTIKLRFKKR